MLLIRSEQMHALAQDAERRFQKRVLQEFNVEYAGVPYLQERIVRAIARAEQYGLIQLEHVLWFVDLDLSRGDAWETLPGIEWAHTILSEAEADVAGRQYRLHKRLLRWDRDGY